MFFTHALTLSVSLATSTSSSLFEMAVPVRGMFFANNFKLLV